MNRSSHNGQEQFMRLFNDLVSQGMDPNEAAVRHARSFVLHTEAYGRYHDCVCMCVLFMNIYWISRSSCLLEMEIVVMVVGGKKRSGTFFDGAASIYYDLVLTRRLLLLLLT